MNSSGAVSAGHRLTAAAAADILRQGGNAFDAVVAALLTACVCEPVLASLGGGGFLMARPAGGQTRLVDFFCDTPKQKIPADEAEFVEIFADFGPMRQGFHIGSGSVATPGMIPGLVEIAERYGTMPMLDLVGPAVYAARNGVVVTPFQAFLFDVISPILTWSAEARSVFAPDGTLLQSGDLMVNPELAEALLLLGGGQLEALHGAMANSVDKTKAHLTRSDIDAYRPEIRDPIAVSFHGAEIWLNPQPALGGTLVAAMLNRLAGPDSTACAQAIAETDRIWRQSGINAVSTESASMEPGGTASRGTTHVGVIDSDGNTASATVSNGEGHGRIVPGFGFMMNNMLGEDDVNPAGFHNWTPGRRLGSMMTPAIAETGNGTVLALGSGGSNRIRTAVFQVLVNRLAGNMAPDKAVAAARLHFEKGKLDIEDAPQRDDAEHLAELFPDHVLWPDRSLYFGGTHHVERRSDGTLLGAGDDRREGVFLTT